MKGKFKLGKHGQKGKRDQDENRKNYSSQQETLDVARQKFVNYVKQKGIKVSENDINNIISKMEKFDKKEGLKFVTKPRMIDYLLRVITKEGDETKLKIIKYAQEHFKNVDLSKLGDALYEIQRSQMGGNDALKFLAQNPTLTDYFIRHIADDNDLETFGNCSDLEDLG